MIKNMTEKNYVYDPKTRRMISLDDWETRIKFEYQDLKDRGLELEKKKDELNRRGNELHDKIRGPPESRGDWEKKQRNMQRELQQVLAELKQVKHELAGIERKKDVIVRQIQQRAHAEARQTKSYHDIFRR